MNSIVGSLGRLQDKKNLERENSTLFLNIYIHKLDCEKVLILFDEQVLVGYLRDPDAYDPKVGSDGFQE
jgi:hypothetical protein